MEDRKQVITCKYEKWENKATVLEAHGRRTITPISTSGHKSYVTKVVLAEQYAGNIRK